MHKLLRTCQMLLILLSKRCLTSDVLQMTPIMLCLAIAAFVLAHPSLAGAVQSFSSQH